MNCKMLYFLMMICFGYGASNLFGMEKVVLPEQTAEVPGQPLRSERFMAHCASALGKFIFSQNLERETIQRGAEFVFGHNYTTVYFDGSTTVHFVSMDGRVRTPSREIGRPLVDCKKMSFDNFINWFTDKMLASPYQKAKMRGMVSTF